MPKSLDPRIDALYQLPLSEFTTARNALAKEAGKDGAAIKQLPKPPVAAWAVNQLYWNKRDGYDALLRAADEMRRTHKAVIEGKQGDLRSAGREHERALDLALKATLQILKDLGQPVTDTVRHAILNILRALPSDEPAGRLSRALMPGGFEMLAGMKPAKSVGPKVRGSIKAETKGPADLRTQAPRAAPGSADLKRAKAAREAAERAVRDAEQRARRAEFDTARVTRDAAKADKRLEEARETLEQAQQEADAAERAAAAALRARETAEQKSRDADAALAAARARLD